MAQRKLAVMAALLLCLSGAVALAAAAGATGFSLRLAQAPASQTPPFHQQGQTPIAAADYEQGTDCTNPPNTDLWHFVLPGKDATFVSMTATFTLNGVPLILTYPGPAATSVQNGKGVNFVTPAGALLTGATAITSAPVSFFNLSHTCAGEPIPVPTPSIAPLPTPSVPLPSPTLPPLPSATPSSPYGG